MAHVIVANWLANPGEGDHVAEVLTRLTPGIRQEPKVLLFHAQRSVDDPDAFLMYEQYTDPSGYDDHKATAAFQEHVVGDLLPRLKARSVQEFTTLD